MARALADNALPLFMYNVPGTPIMISLGACQTLVDIIDTVLRKHKEPQDVSKYISHILETAHY